MPKPLESSGFQLSGHNLVKFIVSEYFDLIHTKRNSHILRPIHRGCFVIGGRFGSILSPVVFHNFKFKTIYLQNKKTKRNEIFYFSTTSDKMFSTISLAVDPYKKLHFMPSKNITH